jgi:hypothetical protein
MSAPREPRNAPRGFNDMRLLANEAARAHRATLLLDSGVLCSRRIRKWPLWTWPHDRGSSAGSVLDEHKAYGKHAQTTSLGHLFALLSGSLLHSTQLADEPVSCEQIQTALPCGQNIRIALAASIASPVLAPTPRSAKRPICRTKGTRTGGAAFAGHAGGLHRGADLHAG